MDPKIFHIYGPIYLHCYSVALAIGLLIFGFFCIRDARRKSIMSKDDFIDLVVESALSGIIGARILHIISDYKNYNFWDMLKIWEGGLSVLGGVIAVLIYCSIKLRHSKASLLSILDLAAIYAPLFNSIVRIGCFFEGCCFGSPTDLFFGVVYTHPESLAPLNIKIHPSQLYTSFFSFMVFLFMYYISRKRTFFSGQLLVIYLMFLGIERLTIDFFRGDKIDATVFGLNFLSFYQWISLLIFILSLTAFVFISRPRKQQ